MRYYTQFIDWVKPPLPIDVVEDAICKGKELLVGFTAHTLGLLIPIGLDFGAHDEMTAHVGLYGFPLPFFPIEVHRLIVDKNLFYRRHLQQCLRRYFDIDRGVVIASVYTQHTFILLEIIREDMQQRCHKEVCNLCHTVTVFIAEHITNRLTLFIETWVITTFLPHPLVLIILPYIVGRVIYIKLLIPKIICLHTDLHGGLALLDKWLPDFVKLSLCQLQY